MKLGHTPAKVLWGASVIGALTACWWLLTRPSVVSFADSHPNMAGWLQAFGSLAALAVAIGLSVHQANAARTARLDDYRRARGDRIDGIAALMEDVYWQLKLASDAASNPEPIQFLNYMLTQFDPSRLDRAVDALLAAPIHEMGNWQLVVSAIEMREIGIRAKVLFRHIVETASPDTVYRANEVIKIFIEANSQMRRVVRAQAKGEFLSPTFGEWKEHLD